MYRRLVSTTMRKGLSALPTALRNTNAGSVTVSRFSAMQSRSLSGDVVKECPDDKHIVTIEEAKQMIRTYRAMTNDTLLTLAAMGDQEACEERLIREIMAVDNVSWHDAQPKFGQILDTNRAGLFMATLPYKFAIVTSFSAGIFCLPMIFELNTVSWFNELYVTTDVPDDKDLETPLEVGSWAWNWMEPPLGAISFTLLCMQYARAQMENLGIKPYTRWFLRKRAERLCTAYPMYHTEVLKAFSEGDPLAGGSSSSV